MAFTQTDIDNLKAAIATGARRVRFGAGPDSRESEFKSLDEMQRALAQMEAEVLGRSAGPFVTFAEHTRD